MSAAATPSRTGRTPYVVVLTLTLAVFAAVVAFVTWQLRGGLREQILSHEGDWFATVASMQLENEAEQAARLGLADVPGGLLAAVLKTSNLRGVIAVSVFDEKRQYVMSVPVRADEPPPPVAWAELEAGRSRALLHPRESLAALAGAPVENPSADATVPVVEVWVPLRRAGNAPLAGAAQFWIDGSELDSEFRALDRRLVAQAGAAWIAGAIVIATALAWAFRRLAAANRELQTRGEDLQRANRELVLSAKMSALGAVTAHLIHEIKNPVAGLEVYVANQAEGGVREESGGELVAATELTRRLRTMINDVVGVLRDEQHGASFELTCGEIIELAIAKARPAAERRGVRLVADAAHAAALPGRQANLVSLVLHNLLQNAVEAAPADTQVRLASRAGADGAVEFHVEDTGPGLPDAVRARLFQPVTSTKPGGSGLGLVLSHQLAQQAGGRLELLRSDARGTCFRVLLPLER